MFDREFEKAVKKFFRQEKWIVRDSRICNFTLERGIFRIHVLLGPEYFDLRFPVVEAYYSKKLVALRNAFVAPVVLVVIRDRATVHLYKSAGILPVALVHLNELHFTKALDQDLLDVSATDEASLWAIQLVSSNAPLSQLMSRKSMSAKNLDQALLWAECAVAADDRDATSHFEVAGALVALGRVEQAALAIEKATSLNPDHPGILKRASTIATKQENYQAALAFAIRSVAAGARGAADYHNLAMLHARALNLEAAEIAARQAVLLAPDTEVFKSTLSRIRFQLAQSLDNQVE